jgi:hypothetical protein
MHRPSWSPKKGLRWCERTHGAGRRKSRCLSSIVAAKAMIAGLDNRTGRDNDVERRGRDQAAGCAETRSRSAARLSTRRKPPRHETPQGPDSRRGVNPPRAIQPFCTSGQVPVGEALHRRTDQRLPSPCHLLHLLQIGAAAPARARTVQVRTAHRTGLHRVTSRDRTTDRSTACAPAR